MGITIDDELDPLRGDSATGNHSSGSISPFGGEVLDDVSGRAAYPAE
jgi:hypothetical protein